MSNQPHELRYDLEVIASWIEPGSRVIDLGCGKGELLWHLKNIKKCIATGIEQDEDEVAICIQKGLSVLQGDLNKEVLDYPDGAFDYVVLSQTLQQVYRPVGLIRELMRIGKRVIVSFPNFSHWSIRLQVMFTGYAPKNKLLPYDWFDTPNIRVITINDFRKFARDLGYRVLREAAINTNHQAHFGRIVRIFPNLRATYGIFMIGKKGESWWL